jgi:hypothetical protein
MTLDIPTLIALVGVISVLSGALGTILTSLVSSRSEAKRLKLDEIRSPSDVANLNVSAATQVAGISVQQTSLFAQLVTECNMQKKALQEENILLRTQKFELKIKIRTSLEELKNLFEQHEEKFVEQEIICVFYVPCQQKINEIIQDLSSSDEDKKENAHG